MKFSIRELLLVTVIVALAVGWWVDRSRLVSGKSAIERDAHDLGRFSDPFGGGLPGDRVKELQRKYFPVEGKLPTSQAPAPDQPGKK